MSVTLKFVKGGYLSTYVDRSHEQCDRHVVQVDRLLRIKSKTKPPASGLPEFDLRTKDLEAVRKVRIRAPHGEGRNSKCINHNPTLTNLHIDRPLNPPEDLIDIEVRGGHFSYPHSMVKLPMHPGREKPFGWIQVDFATGPVTVELLSAAGDILGTYTVYDGQAFDIAGYIMYKYEEGAIDEELLAAYAGAQGPVIFKVLEQSDGNGGPPPPPS